MLSVKDVICPDLAMEAKVEEGMAIPVSGLQSHPLKLLTWSRFGTNSVYKASSHALGFHLFQHGAKAPPYITAPMTLNGTAKWVAYVLCTNEKNEAQKTQVRRGQSCFPKACPVSLSSAGIHPCGHFHGHSGLFLWCAFQQLWPVDSNWPVSHFAFHLLEFPPLWFIRKGLSPHCTPREPNRLELFKSDFYWSCRTLDNPTGG